MNYLLEEKVIYPSSDEEYWEKWYSNYSNRVVAITEIGTETISTVFLGHDDYRDELGKPLFFETYFFKSGFLYRWSNFNEAEKNHYRLVREFKQL